MESKRTLFKGLNKANFWCQCSLNCVKYYCSLSFSFTAKMQDSEVVVLLTKFLLLLLLRMDMFTSKCMHSQLHIDKTHAIELRIRILVPSMI